VPVAAELLAEDDDPRWSVVALIRHAYATLPAGVGQVALRMAAGYFAVAAALAAQALGMVFAIGVMRNAAVWRAAAAVPDSAYVPVIGMDDTEVAVIPYAPPTGWPDGIVCWPGAPGSRPTPSPVTPAPAGAGPSPKAHLHAS
jgi:hypothetical protein